MSILKIKDVEYQIEMMPTFTQLLVLKRLLPLITRALPLIKVEQGKIGAAGSGFDMMDVIGAVVDSMGTLPDHEMQELVTHTLSTVSRKSGQGWAPVWNAQVRQFIFNDMTLADLFHLVGEALRVNYGPFSEDLMSRFPRAAMPDSPPA